MLRQHAQENLSKPSLINTLQGVAADLIPNQPDLAAPIKDLINRPLFLSTLRQMKPGAALAQRDALINELARIYTPETLQALHHILNGLLDITDQDTDSINTTKPETRLLEEDWKPEHEDRWNGSYALSIEDLGLHASEEIHPPYTSQRPMPNSRMEANAMEHRIFGHLDDVAEILKVPVGYILQWCIDNHISIGNPTEAIDFETATYIRDHYRPSRFRRITKILALTSCIAAIGGLIIAAINK